MPHLSRMPKIWIHGGNTHEASINVVLEGMDKSPLSPTERPAITINDRALLIYTSGTTGLPKAASISHRRILNWGGWFAGLTNATSEDRLYNCLPIYHSVGGIVAPCSMLSAGASVVLADKFSAAHFWRDIVRSDCTLFQYIGELCRYLLKAPVSEFEGQHRLRLACGNGLRRDIWEAFQARFAIAQILEFYAATEGNFSLYNVEGRPGAIGRVPPFLTHRFPVALVRFDAALGTPLRAADGLCIPCDRNEAGEAIGRIGIAGDGGGRFEGYTDATETEKKILRDVFSLGDAWFPYRRSDDARCKGLLLFRRPGRRHLSLERRERCNIRSEPRPFWIAPELSMQLPTVWRSPAPRDAPEWLRSWSTAVSILGNFSPILRAGCRLMRVQFSSAFARARYHRNLQAEKAGIGSRGF